MTNSSVLRSKIDEIGISISAIARRCNMCREAFYKKMNNETEFKASEITKITSILNLTNAERDRIFLQSE